MNEEKETNDKMCSECEMFYSVPEKELCSECSELQVFKEQKIDFSFFHNHSFFSSPIITRHFISIYFKEIFDYYREKKYWNHRILNDKKFGCLRRVLRYENSPNKIARILLGLEDFPPIALLSHQADTLWEDMRKDKKERNVPNYKMIHIIGPVIIDLWNCRTADTIFLCYYKKFGQLKIPDSFSKLYKMWRFTDVNNYLHSDFVTISITLDECCICLENVHSDHKIGKCITCNKFYHENCLDSADTLWKEGKCPHCISDI